MPCRYDPTPDEIEAGRANAVRQQKAKEGKLIADLDKLTHENDMLRETVLYFIDVCDDFDLTYILDDGVKKAIYANQVAHRKEDLARLGKVFKKNKDAEKLGLVILADPNQPLEPQLGFDPDEF